MATIKKTLYSVAIMTTCSGENPFTVNDEDYPGAAVAAIQALYHHDDIVIPYDDGGQESTLFIPFHAVCFAAILKEVEDAEAPVDNNCLVEDEDEGGEGEDEGGEGDLG